MKNFTLYVQLFLITVLISGYFTATAQNVDFHRRNFPDDRRALRQALRSIKEGDKYYDMGQGAYPRALEHYLKAQAFNPNNALLNYRLGKCYLFTPQKDKSIKHLEKALKLDPNVALDAPFLLARGYHLTMEFEKAIDLYARFRNNLSPSELGKYAAAVERRIEQCKTGIELVANPVRVFIDNLGSVVNSKYPEYSPMISADESVIIFTSRRDNTTGGGIDPQDQRYYEDIYISRKVNGKWTAPENPGKPLNTDGHDATAGLSPDGQTLFVYRGTKGGNIYTSQLEGNRWTRARRMPRPIRSKHHESSASLSPDGRTIYFVSQRPGGYGGRDIYKSTKDDRGRWGPAENLGPVINTPYDEESVFMHPDGKTLYFSSQGHRGMGGYDIFKSVYENGQWSEPENLGYPINTPDDDVFFIMAASGVRGYYSSERLGGYGGQDLYMITFLGDEKPVALNTEDDLLAIVSQPFSGAVIESAVDVGTSRLTLLKGFVKDEQTLKPLHASIELYDNELNEQIANFNSNSATGRYLVSLPSGRNYGLSVKADGYLFYSENFNIAESQGFQEIERDILLKKVEVGTSIVLNNIFFDFDRASIRQESFSELERLTKLLNDLSRIRIEISGHTDNIGSAAYNQRLSENRAKAVVDYLISQGISKDRLEYKGYGFEKPIATNDTEEGRQMNRRTEFKIISK